ncbi:BRO-N domain-containing protein [Ancylobacter terrae]|uniref:BRO-N domain-containing protein n=1 Tax=Ancylobacter sp. sgz301288 TaxID=3342077 RepID=UPI00385ADCFD
MAPKTFFSRRLISQSAGNGDATTTYRIRVVPLEGNPWFVAADCRRVLNIKQAGSNLAYLAEDEKRVIRESGSTSFKGHGLAVISESGLYKLIMRSDKPQARVFQDWVTKEVLPTIRKTGGYVLQGADWATVGEGTVSPVDADSRRNHPNHVGEGRPA